MFKKKYFSQLLIFCLSLLFSFDVNSQSSHPKIPIVYSDLYNIRLEKFVGPVAGWCLGFVLPRVHPFDGEKYGKIYNSLTCSFVLDASSFYDPEVVTDDQILGLDIHSREYLDMLKNPDTIAAISEISWLGRFSSETLEQALLIPMRLATGGTLRACRLALECGWAINLSGGYHHAKKEIGGGFCFFADIPYAVCSLWKDNPKLKVMIVDLDAHQGNGYEDFFKDDPRIAAFDVYNKANFPHDYDAARFIRYNFPVDPGMSSDAYLGLLQDNLLASVIEFKPDLIVYNAGTDILAGDLLGGFEVSAQATIERDQHVFEVAETQEIPIVMLLSGGYSLQSADIVARSLGRILISKGFAVRIPSGKEFGLLKWFTKK